MISRNRRTWNKQEKGRRKEEKNTRLNTEEGRVKRKKKNIISSWKMTTENFEFGWEKRRIRSRTKDRKGKMSENKKKIHKNGDGEKKERQWNMHEIEQKKKEKHWDRDIKKEWRKERKEKGERSKKRWTKRWKGKWWKKKVVKEKKVQKWSKKKVKQKNGKKEWSFFGLIFLWENWRDKKIKRNFKKSFEKKDDYLIQFF